MVSVRWCNEVVGSGNWNGLSFLLLSHVYSPDACMWFGSLSRYRFFGYHAPVPLLTNNYEISSLIDQAARLLIENALLPLRLRRGLQRLYVTVAG